MLHLQTAGKLTSHCSIFTSRNDVTNNYSDIIVTKYNRIFIGYNTINNLGHDS